MGTLIEEEISYVTGGEDVSDRAEVPAVRLQPGEIAPGTRYRIENWLGEGGVGVVYECVHVDLERRVAMKVLKAAVSPQAAQLFRAEARAAVRSGERNERSTSLHFGSPYIVEVFDFGEFPDGRLWFAMELLHGTSLSHALKKDGKPIAIGPDRAVGILRQVCKGLFAAHRAGVVHRDVKPANIMLVRRGNREDAVKLVDFGVSAIGSNEAESGMVGTPPYMAPEQTTGSTFDQRLDIYAVGVVAYRMLTGRVPFAATTLFQLLKKHREETPEPPSSINPGVTPAVENVVLKCLAKKPSDRYENMADLEAALCEAQIDDKLRTPWDGLPLPDVAPARRERIARLMPRSEQKSKMRLVWPAVAALAVAVAGIVSIGRGATEDVGDESDELVDRLVDEARAAGARAEWVYPAPSHPDGPTAYQKVIELERLGTVPAGTMGTQLRAEFAQALVALGDRYWEHPQGQAFALDYYAQAQLFDPDLVHERARGAITVGELALLRKRAETLDFTERDLEATEALAVLAEPDEAAREEKLRELIAEGSPRSETSEARLSAILEESGADQPHSKTKRDGKSGAGSSWQSTDSDPDADADPGTDPDAEPIEATSPDEEPSSSGSRSSARALAKKGTTALNQADRSTAAKLFNRALAADRNNAEAHFGLGRIAYDRGDYGKAVKHFERAVALSSRSGRYRITLGDAYYKTFRYQDARREYAKAKDLGHKSAKSRLEKVDAKIQGG